MIDVQVREVGPRLMLSVNAAGITMTTRRQSVLEFPHISQLDRGSYPPQAQCGRPQKRMRDAHVTERRSSVFASRTSSCDHGSEVPLFDNTTS